MNYWCVSLLFESFIYFSFLMLILLSTAKNIKTERIIFYVFLHYYTTNETKPNRNERYHSKLKQRAKWKQFRYSNPLNFSSKADSCILFFAVDIFPAHIFRTLSSMRSGFVSAIILSTTRNQAPFVTVGVETYLLLVKKSVITFKSRYPIKKKET